jgi:hypothetical protein
LEGDSTLASPFQQQSLRRKIVYIVLILVLFTASLFLRQGKGFGIDSRGQELGLREETIGEPELMGSAIRLTLTGSRGLAVCALWVAAQDKQKKNEWNELELLVNSITKLQPHFITPWLFQSWNLSYNVSVESDRVSDKYFYITRGIELLAEGERQNKNNPDLRFTLGFYNHHKIGLSDEANTFRCLYQMSAMDPVERDPERFRTPETDGNVINKATFEQFCRRHAMFVRRLRESLKRDKPSDVVDFLAENQKIPSRYEEKISPSSGRAELKSPDKQFPCLPPIEADDRGDRADPDAIDFDNFQVARDWFTYAQKPLPPPSPELGPVNPAYDPTKFRMPRAMMVQIFRGRPALGQTFVADYLEREGWFDRDGWKITGEWFPDDKFTGGKDAVVGDGTDWAARSWAKAHDMWKTYGNDTGLYMDPESQKNLDDLAALYRTQFEVSAGRAANELPAEYKGTPMEESYRAHNRLFWFKHFRGVTNFPHFYFLTQVRQEPGVIEVRKKLFLAEQLRKTGDREQAAEVYREAVPKWRDILLSHQGFRRDSIVQEDSAETAYKYMELVRDINGKQFKELMIFIDFLAQEGLRPPVPLPWLPPAVLARDVTPTIAFPFDGRDPEGTLIISHEAKHRTRTRLGLPNPPGSTPYSAEDIAPSPYAPAKP